MAPFSTPPGDDDFAMLGQTYMNGLTVDSDWMDCYGDAATFLLEVIARVGGTATVTIQHKNRGEADSAASNGANTISATTTGVFPARNSGLKQLWRYRLVVGGSASSDWVHARFLEVVWETN